MLCLQVCLRFASSIGIMVFDNQPRGRLGDGSGYVHSSCFEAMQTSATLGSTQETQTHAFMRTSMTLAADVVSEAIKAAQSQAQSQANPSTPLPLKESVTGVSPPRDTGAAAPGDKGICRICGVMVCNLVFESVLSSAVWHAETRARGCPVCPQAHARVNIHMHACMLACRCEPTSCEHVSTMARAISTGSVLSMRLSTRGRGARRWPLPRRCLVKKKTWT